MGLDFCIYDIGQATKEGFELLWESYTHNVVPMWHKAKIYDELYNNDGKHPKEIVDALRRGLKDMQEYPEEYKLLNPENGWGSYDTAMKFLSAIIVACEKYPDAIIRISK